MLLSEIVMQFLSIKFVLDAEFSSILDIILPANESKVYFAHALNWAKRLRNLRTLHWNDLCTLRATKDSALVVIDSRRINWNYLTNLMWYYWCEISISTTIANQCNGSNCMGIIWVRWNLNRKTNEFNCQQIKLHFKCVSNWICFLTVTSISLTNFHTLCELILARSCNFVPIGTAWSTGSSFWFRMACCCLVWFFKWLFRDAILAVMRPNGGASLYNATSYSKRPGVSSTTPDTRAPCGL